MFEKSLELIEASKSDKNIKDVMDAVSYLVSKNLEESFPLLKEIFFHPLTAHKIRLEIGKIIASTKNKQVYNLLVSYLILRNFSDLSAVIYTLGEYGNKEVYSFLVREFPTCNFDAKLQVVSAIEKIKSPESLEFFSKIYNGDFQKEYLNPEQLQKLKERAGSALQNQVIDL
jgi:hypothetical protein